MKNPKIAVFCGGISPERDVSLVSGKNVAEALSKNFDTILVRLDKNELPQNLDPREFIIYPAMHGDYGEDGTLQKELDAKGFVYAGCDSLSSRVCMVKSAAKALMSSAGISVAKSLDFIYPNVPEPFAAFSMFPEGAIVKPSDKGSSVGLSVVKTLAEMETALASIKSGMWLVEDFCKGKELSVGVIYGKSAGIVQITPQGGVYDFKRKYTAGSTLYDFPAKISPQAEQAIKSAAEKAFKVCGCRDFARVDFILINEENPEYIALEINTLPGMTPTSLLPKSASCRGYDFDSLCAKLVEGAIKRFSEKYS